MHTLGDLCHTLYCTPAVKWLSILLPGHVSICCSYDLWCKGGISLDGRGMFLEGKGMSLEGRGMSLEGRGMSLEGRGMSLEGRGISLEGDVPGREGDVPGGEGDVPGREGMSLVGILAWEEHPWRGCRR